ncbi:4480_t:CDS:2 [Acaulospora colombiana]|uniref:4480_t:CDS:1 n=1 Tax=Acaulospora colombiana TaxID=27376 RepID=A0ACA9MVF7_9GLOM|nr:4480_t:CDS:2 [Acaulospora colombiana]
MRSATSLTGYSKFPEVTFSGIQPTGIPHIGNFLGALSNWVSPQQTTSITKTALYTIVDLHALTVPQDPTQLRKNKVDMTISLLACGLDPATVLTYLVDLGTSTFRMCMDSKLYYANRMAKSQKKNVQSIEDADTSSGLCLGLLAYPVLQAADILLYKATHVPIGEDNVQHLELARDIAQKINKLYKQDIFPLPQPILAPAKRIMSLRDPTKKMSKSDPLEQSRINLNDLPSTIALKIKKATTDTIKGITYDPENRPAISNLVTIYAAVQGVDVEEIVEEHSASDTMKFKEALTNVLIEKLTPLQKEIERLKNEHGYVQQVLQEGNEKASLIANKNLDELYKLFGLR